MSKKMKEALMLPVCVNLNPRSLYNKSSAFSTFIKEHQVGCMFLSESWERPEYDLSKLIDIDDYTVVSNPHQRKGKGGRPALVINTKNYHVRNLTNTLIQIPWGCEATWALLTPKNVTSASVIQKIAVCSLYSKPDSRAKTKLLDHISLGYNILSAKYQTGLHFIFAGDTNDLKLQSVLQLNPRMQQMVRGITRLDPPRMLDPILTTLGSYYQTPEILPPLESDVGGSPSDHLIPIMRPVNEINNRCSRSYRTVQIRPITASGIKQLGIWFEGQDWLENLTETNIDKKADILQRQILDAVNKYLPEKALKIASDDQPWFTQPLKKLDRRRRREYHRNRKSQKYLQLSATYELKLSRAKKKFKRDMIDDISSSKSGEWYAKLKRISRYDQGKSEVVQVEEICHLTAQQQAERIADKISEISNTYKEVQISDIIIPPFSSVDIPQFSLKQVKEYISRLKPKKATPLGDIPSKIIKEFASYICIPLSDIINSSIKMGHWASSYKKEVITPIPKEYPVQTIDMLRPISALVSFNKIQEMAICELIIEDMSATLDSTQFGNRRHLGISHYLIRMVHKILSETDRNSRGEVNAILCMFIDWKQAYSRQSHILGVKSFIQNGVRPSLIPVLISYFQSRKMRIKWHGALSKPRKMPGSGAMGSSIGNQEFSSQTNHNSDCVPKENRFKFVDDLSVLEIINLISIGIKPYDITKQVPNDLPIHAQYVDSQKLKSQEYLNEINRWTVQQEMIISEKKTKAMIVNFTNNHQFHTRLQLKGQNVEVVTKMKILGTIITNTLDWGDNCDLLIRKVNSRMQLLRKVWSFGSNPIEMVHLWKVYCRSVLEQSCVLWDSSLTEDNRTDLERTQKTFCKLVLEEDYQNYNNALKILHLQTLDQRRKILTLKLAETGIKNGTMNDLFPHKKKTHNMTTRSGDYYKITHANTKRFQNSPVLAMQRMLNNNKDTN